jgi:hypothetical protein
MYIIIYLLYVKVDMLISCGNHFHDYIISLRQEVWAHKTSLTLPLFIEVPVLIQEPEQSCNCVLRVSIWPLSTILIFDFRINPTLLYFFYFFLSLKLHIVSIYGYGLLTNIKTNTTLTRLLIPTLKVILCNYIIYF